MNSHQRYIFLAVLALLFCGYILPASAQTKVGYIDSKKIIDAMQETQDAKSRLDNLVAEWQTELKVLQDSLKAMKEDYENKKLILTDQLKQQLEQEIKDMEAQVEDFKIQKFGENGEYFQKQVEFMKPVHDKIFSAIQKVASEDDYDYIFDRNSEILLLYVNERYDITAKVLELVQGP
ncbi:MAG: OmpH family outer membrane protein [Ignavibacteriae bacterium]|nr:OmpH family outer membrane protein [Ignavibacteriota bacterium]